MHTLLKTNIYPLQTGNRLMCTLAKSEDPDEMPQNVLGFHQSLHCL